MKLASHLHEGRASWGVVLADGLLDGSRLLGGRFPTLKSVLAADALGAVREAVVHPGEPRIPLAQVRWLPTLPDPERILCIGLNYRAHVAEVNRELPPEPSVFVRLASTLVPHGGIIERPRVSEALDFEGELAVVIGRGGRHIAVADALSHVAGYTCFNDVSVRDFQKHSVGAGKNFHATGPLGPWMVTSDVIRDPSQLTLTTRLNGQEVQQTRTDTLVYSIPTIIAYLSQVTPLAAGDVIATGTPAGVGAGRKPPLWMKAGDVIDVEVEGIGVLSNPVADEEGVGPVLAPSRSHGSDARVAFWKNGTFASVA